MIFRFWLPANGDKHKRTKGRKGIKTITPF